MKRSVTVELVRSGQPRAYADAEYEAYLTFSTPPDSNGWASKFGWGEGHRDIVKQYVPLFVHSFHENPEWHQAWLKTLEYIGDGKWHVLVISPYLD